jgi:GNAT superfamily N-acetyltransferase
MSLLIRNLRDEDEMAYRELFRDYLRSYGLPVEEAKVDEEWSKLTGPHYRARTRVLLDGPKMLGFISYLNFPAKPGTGEDCHLEDLFIIEEARGRGLGKVLFDTLVDTARAEGCLALHCHPNDTDFAAQAIFDRYARPDQSSHYYISL